jgi:hypothetical protein
MKKTLFFFTFIIVTSNFLISQDNVFRFKTKPNESRGYLCWENYDSSYYVLELSQKIKDLDTEYFKTIERQQLKINYSKINSKYLASNDIYYKVSAFNNLNQVIISSEWIPACIGCGESYAKVCSWICNGPSYAWELSLLGNSSNSSGLLQLSTAYDYYDYTAGIAIPYYEPISPVVYNARITSNYYDSFYSMDIITGQTPSSYYYNRTVSSNEHIIDAQGNVLSGTVHFIGKQLMQYEPLQPISTNILTISETECGNSKQWAINKYNSFPNTPLPFELDCQNAYTIPSGGTSPSGNPTSNAQGHVEFIFYLIECMGETYWANEFNLDDVLLGLPCSKNEQDQWTPIDIVSSNIRNVEINRIDKTSDRLVFTGNSLFESNSNFISNNVNFPIGLYLARFFFEDGSSLPLVVEKNWSNTTIINNSYFSDLQITPNPIENKWLSFKINVQRRMKFDLEILTLDGEILHKEKKQMQENTTLERSIKINKNIVPYNQVIVKMIFEDGSIKQSIAYLPN